MDQSYQLYIFILSTTILFTGMLNQDSIYITAYKEQWDFKNDSNISS